MKVAILAGGLGTRLAEETEVKPKPMVEVGGRPILWHIMKLFSQQGVHEFFVALGYRGDVIKRYFLDHYALSGSLSISLDNGDVRHHGRECEPWAVHLVETGGSTNTGGRIGRLSPFLKGETFLATYGDGVSDVDVNALLAFHRSHGKIATLTAVRPPARFGEVIFEGDLVRRFSEKPQTGEGWINGGFFVFEPKIFDYISGDDCSLEADALEKLASEGQLAAFRHPGFWQCMDTLREKTILQNMWDQGRAPWKTWT